MSYINKKYKMRQLWIDVDKVGKDIEDNNKKIDIVEDKRPKSKKYYLKRIRESSSSWINLESDGENRRIYKEWSISFSKVPNRLIPYIKHKVVYETEYNVSFPYINHFIQINVERSTNKDITLRVGVTFEYSGTEVPNVIAKLFVYIINPELYT